jgi:outer membrane protein OmpA-like peptidoglycan-associated protein
MKQKITLFLSFLAVATFAFAQSHKPSSCTNCTHRELIGIHLDALDVNSPKSWKDGTGTKSLAGLKEQDLGFSFSYWKALCCYNIDWSVKGSILFHNYSAVDRKTYSSSYNQFGMELEPSVNAYLFKRDNMFNAFVTAGLGIGDYSKKFGAYIPAGLGLSANLSNSTYLVIQTQYRSTLTKDVMRDNVFHSFGILQNMAPEKPKAVVPPPPPPVVDRDNDGVMDTDDKCPDVKGMAKYNGCPIPDTDGDGLDDEQDKCPAVAGSSKYGGCPVPDTDGDGINDEQDKCVNEKGLARYQGCPIPDTDKDGVNDEEDKCPAVAGLASNMGCPEIKKEVIEKVNFVAKNIEYGTGSAKILSSSFKSLNELVEVLKADPSLLLTIDGYSDNVGGEERNKQLSQERANSVKEYIASKGIAMSRMTATGHGQDNPIADNKTAAGRAKNRRTEMKVNNH